ncbi:hypothetical protein B0H16DRAFT_1477187 [Mycena metata]|uniref:Uncharacterized protein n=1 Tax=Mycena metata TaxID=1033252 RepID=A0AAD7H9H0_9AGAR|nr:hypothetical protein B0H16DRAFT_1477187 [Mycena metata]
MFDWKGLSVSVQYNEMQGSESQTCIGVRRYTVHVTAMHGSCHGSARNLLSSASYRVPACSYLTHNHKNTRNLLTSPILVKNFYLAAQWSSYGSAYLLSEGPLSPKVSCGIWSTTPRAPTIFPEAPVPAACNTNVGNIAGNMQDRKSQMYCVPSTVRTQNYLGTLLILAPIPRTAEQLHTGTAQDHFLPYELRLRNELAPNCVRRPREANTGDASPNGGEASVANEGISCKEIDMPIQIALLPTVSKITLNSCLEYLDERMFENSEHVSSTGIGLPTQHGTTYLRVEEVKRQFGDTAAWKREQDPLKAEGRFPESGGAKPTVVDAISETPALRRKTDCRKARNYYLSSSNGPWE